MAKMSLGRRSRGGAGARTAERTPTRHAVSERVRFGVLFLAVAVVLVTLSISSGFSLSVKLSTPTDPCLVSELQSKAPLHKPHLVQYQSFEGRITTDKDNVGNKTLVILLGSLRGGELTWKSLYRNVLDLLQADLALMIGEVPAAKQNSSLYDRAKYIWEFPEYSDWGQAIDLIGSSHDVGVTWRDLALKTKGHSSIFGPARPSWTGSGAINYMARWFVTQEIIELSLLERYNRFIISRSDNYHLCEHPSMDQLDSRFIWLPEGEDYKGFPDRHLVLSRTNVLPALHILPPLVKHPKKYLPVLHPKVNPEILTAMRWKEDGLLPLVRRFPRSMFLAAKQGDTTRWKKAKYWFRDNTPLNGLAIKYLVEYQNSSDACSVHWNYTEIEDSQDEKEKERRKKQNNLRNTKVMSNQEKNGISREERKKRKITSTK